MKTLVLVRHAKSSWEFAVKDHERPLTNRGLTDANLVSNALKKNNFNFDLVLSSTANRAKTTAQVFTKNLNISNTIFKLETKLYDFSGNDLINVIKSCDNSINTLLIFGHNYAITAFVNSYGSVFIDNVPTCGVVMLSFNIENWNGLKKGETLKTIYPRDLK